MATSIDRSRIDFRALLQKCKTGRWQHTAVVARIADKNSIITSPRSGGGVEYFSTVMNEQCLSSRKTILKSIRDLSMEVAKTLEDQVGHFAELGLDFGVDVQGKVWLIEVNGKPLKVSIEMLKNAILTRKSYTRPLEYAVYLSGF